PQAWLIELQDYDVRLAVPAEPTPEEAAVLPPFDLHCLCAASRARVPGNGVASGDRPACRAEGRTPDRPSCRAGGVNAYPGRAGLRQLPPIFFSRRNDTQVAKPRPSHNHRSMMNSTSP